MKTCFRDINADLNFLKNEYGVSKMVGLLTNRGVQSLIGYRLAHLFYSVKIPLFPLIITRLIQILYSIDIDYRAKLEGGIIIIHGVGLVIGKGVKIKSQTIIYHQVTLGIKGTVRNDGFPLVNEKCILGAGSKLFGPIVVGKNSCIGANVVVTKDVEENSLVKMQSCIIKKIN